MPAPRINLDSAEPQTLDDVLDWYRAQLEAIQSHRNVLIQSIQSGNVVSPRYMGFTESDIDRRLDAQRRELDRLTLHNLVASAEATIKLDFFRRLKDRPTNPLAQAYQAWHRKLTAKKQLRPDFDEGGILDVLREANVMDRHVIGQFRAGLRVRHWLGHGRYWTKPPEVDTWDPQAVYQRARALILALPA